MPQSLARVPVHLVFSVKDRRPILNEDLQLRLHPYLAGILKSEGNQPIIVGGHTDHVHLLFGLSRTQTIAKIVEIVKLGSSRWLSAEGVSDFYWQGGYAMFGISEGDVPSVVKYIANQAEHHRTTMFEDELRKMMNEYGIAFDERYVWQ